MDNKELTIEQTHSGAGHNIARDLYIYTLGDYDFAGDLALAVLIGSWDESKEDDIATVEFITNEKYSDWIIRIRKIESIENSPLEHHSGHWSVKDREKSWVNCASRLFNDHLDKFHQVTVEILSTLDPKFELNPEDRFAASIHGKVLSHSLAIRNGLSEGVSLIGTRKKYLVNCSHNYGEYIANETVDKIFNNSNWALWASTKDIQPIIAEASPSKFLDAVEAAVNHPDRPFNVLFSQEGVGGVVTGSNYMTGLLWALESLAWSPIYLTRCIVLLGEIDSYDPGGNWTNRAKNSIVDILLPWLPHTTACFERRYVSLKVLEREFPEAAWGVLLQLLPNNFSSTSGTNKPRWQKFIPENFNNEVSEREYFEQVTKYSNYTVELAKKNHSRLPSLIENLDHLIDSAFYSAIELLSDYAKNTSENRYDVWLELINFINKHKKYSEAEWALDERKLILLEPIALNLEPIEKSFFYRRLFSNNNMDLYEEKGNWRDQDKLITKCRSDAIAELFAEGGYDLVYDFSQVVDSASLVGSALASIVDVDDEDRILEYLQKDDLKSKQFISEYILNRNYLTEGEFIVNLNLNDWKEDSTSQIFVSLPFGTNTWDKVDKYLGDSFEYLYWEHVNINAFQCDNEDELYRGVEKLLKYNRQLSAIRCLHYILRTYKKLKNKPTVTALIGAVNTKESMSNLDSYEINELIAFLQASDDVAENDLFRVEWAYFPLLSRNSNGKTSAKYLNNRLSTDPEFFNEVIGLAYKSEIVNVDSGMELSEQQQNIAQNAYNILDNWDVIPGLQVDGGFSSSEFNCWLKATIDVNKQSGHLNSALSIIGKLLVKAPKGDDGLWIHSAIAEFLNQREFDKVRRAYKIAVYNSRGVHFIDPEGKPEIELSESYQLKSEVMESLGLQRFARTLREISESYLLEAEGRKGNLRNLKFDY